ncbi:unnamed protein product [Caenorhabditis sp. 36 PRJEB53466]|nr:unnamed protein product [Caenorhabditis sp. 36 PRJEB53466]
MFYEFATRGQMVSPYYYNCTGTSPFTESKPIVGAIYMSIGVISQIIYVLALYTIFRSPSLFTHPCYKIMFFLGIPDVLCLIFCADLAGFYSIYGLHPCYAINFTFVTGCICFGLFRTQNINGFVYSGLWHMSCMYVLLLAFNRVCELIAPSQCAFLFRSSYFKCLLFLPVFYFIYFTFFTKPTFFQPSVSAFLLNPMSEVTKNFPAEYYTVQAYVFNNFFVMFFIGTCYIIICSYLIIESWKSQIKQTSALVKRVTYQCLIVCTCHFIGCFLYVYIQYFSMPDVLNYVCHFAWIGNHSEFTGTFVD